MKRLLSLSIFVSVIFISVCTLLTGCIPKHYPYPTNQGAEENWSRNVDSNPLLWSGGADRWFKTGEPNATELENRHAPISTAMSTMQVKANGFDRIRVDGDFQVQIYGTYDANSVYVYGPNAGIRQLAVQVNKGVLCVTQEKGSSRYLMHQVIIRIGVNYLKSITQAGCGTIEGVQLHSNAFEANSYGSGNMYLSGNLRLKHVLSTNTGNITIYGVNKSCFNIRSLGSGSINLDGDVRLQNIDHRGSGNINIIGASGRQPVNIYTDGSGKIGIKGQPNIVKIVAKGCTCVYVCQVAGSHINVCQYDGSVVGLMGSSRNLVVETYNKSRFNGRYLCVNNAYVRANDASHVNVSAGDKIFISATQSSSVYFFGDPKIMTKFVGGSGVVIPLYSNMYRSCGAPVIPRANSYKGEG